jgi:acid phosphatase family membrane protein YuiD
MGCSLLLVTVAIKGVMMDFSYFVTPFMAWLVAGTLKFFINSISSKKLAIGLVGYGGLPSNHSAIVSSTTALIALKEGIEHPAFGVAITFTFIVMLDANSLRREVGRHAKAINKLIAGVSDQQILRERIGHTRVEIIAGIIVGVTIAAVVNKIFI